MNNQGIYSIKDTKLEAYLPVFQLRNDGEAIRAFDDSVQKPGTPLHDHPEDFYLFRIADYDELTGIITPIVHKSLGCALDFKKEGK